MYRIVGTVFKIIMLSIIFVFVWDMAFYMYRAFTLNQKMEGYMSSMQQIVMKNNYLPESDYIMYTNIFRNLADSMNGTEPNDKFIVGIGTNYGSPVTAVATSGGNTNSTTMRTLDELKVQLEHTNAMKNALCLDMSKPASYGSIMVVQARVKINQPFWNWTTSLLGTNDYGYSGEDGEKWSRKLDYYTKTLYYTYYVPCLQYQTLQDVT